MNKIMNWVIAATLVCGIQSATAQTLRGTVTDAITGEPLIGATVRIVEMTDMAAVADIDGNYVIKVKQGGRYTVETRYIGYEPSVMKEIMISGAKEVVLDIELREPDKAELDRQTLVACRAVVDIAGIDRVQRPEEPLRIALLRLFGLTLTDSVRCLEQGNSSRVLRH